MFTIFPSAEKYLVMTGLSFFSPPFFFPFCCYCFSCIFLQWTRKCWTEELILRFIQEIDPDLKRQFTFHKVLCFHWGICISSVKKRNLPRGKVGSQEKRSVSVVETGRLFQLHLFGKVCINILRFCSIWKGKMSFESCVNLTVLV